MNLRTLGSKKETGNFSLESLLRKGSVVYSDMRFLQNHTHWNRSLCLLFHISVCFLPGQYRLKYLPVFFFFFSSHHQRQF